MEGLFDNLEGRSDSQNFELLTSTLRFSLCTDVLASFYGLKLVIQRFSKSLITNLKSVFKNLKLFKLQSKENKAKATLPKANKDERLVGLIRKRKNDKPDPKVKLKKTLKKHN